jgi:hypothetical protein
MDCCVKATVAGLSQGQCMVQAEHHSSVLLLASQETECHLSAHAVGLVVVADTY